MPKGENIPDGTEDAEVNLARIPLFFSIIDLF